MEKDIDGLDYIALGKRIRNYRNCKNLNQKDLAEMVGIEASNISNIERGKLRMRLSTLVRIAKALDVTPNNLLCDNFHIEKIIYNDEVHWLLAQYTPDSLLFLTSFLEKSLHLFEEYNLIQRIDQERQS